MKKKVIIIAVIAVLSATYNMSLAAVTPSGSIALANVSTKKAVAVKSTEQGSIEYAKKTTSNADGSIAYIDESWADPSTHNERLDDYESVKGDMVRMQSCYVLDDESKYIKASRTDKGSLTGDCFLGKDLGDILIAEKQDYINEYKKETRIKSWKEKGNVKTKDGRKLIKLSRAEKSTIPGDEGKTFIDTIYIDKDSGLPVKGNLHVKKNGKTSLLYTYVFEFKNVVDDGSIFDTKDIILKK
ncbi:MAG: hypothetical protein WCD89_05385 [Anaerocolumna sp.]